VLRIGAIDKDLLDTEQLQHELGRISIIIGVVQTSDTWYCFKKWYTLINLIEKNVLFYLKEKNILLI